MNSVAFVFKHAPHGTSNGREGLDALLATAALSDAIGVFFVGDGVLHLITEQQPGAIYARDYIATLKLLALYDIDTVYACQKSLHERGINQNEAFNIQVKQLAEQELQVHLHHYDRIMTY